MRDFASVAFIERRTVTFVVTIGHSAVSTVKAGAWVTNVTFTVASRVSHPAGTVVSKLIFMTSSRVKARINVTLLGFCA